MTEEKKNRHFILSEDVSQSSVSNLVKEIREINKHDDKQEEEKKEYEREPIEIVVNTYGGSVYDGNALIAAIELSKTPIHTICLGKAMSMGFHIFAEGHKRFAHPLATFMYHDMGGLMGGTLEDIKLTTAEWERLRDMLDERLLKKTNILQDKLQDILTKKENWYISAYEAKKLGLVDEILGA